MEHHFTTDPTVADLIIDVSNVARDRALGGPGEANLHRLALAVQAYTAFVGDTDVLVYGVADASLINSRPPLLRQDEREMLRRWHRQGRLEVQKVADERILELADVTGIPVLSSDGFRDHRDLHPWIQGNTTDFFAALRDPAGRIVIVPRQMTRLTSWRVSRHAERKHLTDQGLATQGKRIRRDVLDRLWFCAAPGCPWFGTETALAQPVPKLTNDRIRCPLHGTELTDHGPRPPAATVKISRNGSQVGSFLVLAGADVVVGRDPGDDGFCLADQLSDDTVLQISRRHLRFTLDNGRLLVHNLSRNETRIQTEHGDRRALGPAEHFHLTHGRVIWLPGDVKLRRSGRMFPYELTSGQRSTAPVNAVAQVTTVPGSPTT